MSLLINFSNQIKMKQDEKQVEQRKIVSKLSYAIQEAIDGICEKNDYNITFAEINAALVGILKTNLQYELKIERKKPNQNETN